MPPIIVIGGGHNGLVCAVRLATAGLPVILLEQACAPGGAVGSQALTLPGFVHDTCAGFFPMTLASPAFRDLGVLEELDWVDPPVAMAHPFPDGTAIALYRDLAQTVAGLEAASPGAGRGWEQVVAPLLARRDRVLRAALTPSFPPVRDGLALALDLRRDGVDLARRMLASAATFGREVLGGERATAWLAGSVLHSDLTPGSAGGAALAYGLAFLGHAVGWGFPRGGAQGLSDALTRRLQALDGELRCGSAAQSVIVRRGRACGVRLAGGEELAADAVVVTLSAAPAAALLPDGALPHRLMDRLQGWRYGLGTLKADFALSSPVPWSSPVAGQAGVVHVGGELPELFAAHHEAGAGHVPAAPAIVVGQHTVHDPSRAPAGRHTLYAYCHVPQRLDIAAEDAADRMQERIEMFAPGFAGTILSRSVRTPADLQRRNPSLVGGDLAAGSCEVDQQLIFRPAPELFRGRTPLPGLYLAGGSVHPGPGVHGVSGAAAARAVLEDRRGLRRVVGLARLAGSRGAGVSTLTARRES